MNFVVVLYIIGWILEFEAVFLLLPVFVAAYYGEVPQVLSFCIAASVSYILGFLLKLRKPSSKELYMREGFVTVAFGWISLSLIGAIPFTLSGDIPRYIDAVFESISGFTTTGASILTDVEVLSKSGLFWRSFTHWIGGMGVFVFIMSILPLMGSSTMNLMKAESTGPSVDKFVPKTRDTAKLLYEIYLGLTVIGCIVFMICGLPFYDAVTIIFGTVGTGGFGIFNTSIGGYNPAVQWAVTIFMLLAGLNYTFYFCLISKKIKEAFDIEEIKWYLFLVAVCIILITVNISKVYGSIGEAIRHASFQVASIVTTTGFSTADFDAWPAFSQTILVILMFVGSCSGCTAGGIKISRVVIFIKSIHKELCSMVHPRQVLKIRMDRKPVPHETVRATNVYFAAYFFTFFASMLLISLNCLDFKTNFTAIVAMMGNIGPGLSLVGPTGNFSVFNDMSKIVLMFDMLAGRLELFPMLILFHPSTWRKY